MEKEKVIQILEMARPYYLEMKEIDKKAIEIYEKEKMCKKTLLAGEIALGIFLIMLYIFPGVIYFIVINKKKERLIQKSKEEIQNERQVLDTEAQQLCVKFYETGIDTILPQKIWTNLNDMLHIYSYYDGGRVDSIKEALNLLAEDQHREKMESMQAQMLHNQQVTNQQLYWGNMLNAATAINTSIISKRI